MFQNIQKEGPNQGFRLARVPVGKLWFVVIACAGSWLMPLACAAEEREKVTSGAILDRKSLQTKLAKMERMRVGLRSILDVAASKGIEDARCERKL